MKIVVLGLSLSSSWGNGHATTYRALLRALAAQGHAVQFLEADRPWYAQARDLPEPSFCELCLYRDVADLARFDCDVAAADVVVVGSYVPDGVAVARWALAHARGTIAFYDIDTPVTLQKLASGDTDYIAPELVPLFDLYLSFTGGPTLDRLRREFGARRPHALYCSVDADAYRPVAAETRWDLTYLGTYSPDRQSMLDALLIEPARRRPDWRFAVAGPLYPDTIAWPDNVERIDHVPPAGHPAFYAASRWTLNVTRADMVAAGWSPSVRLFEAGACGAPILSDTWPGLDTLFVPGREIVCAETTEAAVEALGWDEARRVAIGVAGRARVLAAHTANRRADELTTLFLNAGARAATGVAA